jgi:hypothetical protein
MGSPLTPSAPPSPRGRRAGDEGFFVKRHRTAMSSCNAVFEHSRSHRGMLLRCHSVTASPHDVVNFHASASAEWAVYISEAKLLRFFGVSSRKRPTAFECPGVRRLDERARHANDDWPWHGSCLRNVAIQTPPAVRGGRRCLAPWTLILSRPVRVLQRHARQLDRHANELLPFGFSAIPILAEADSFFQSLVNGDQYLCAGHNELHAPSAVTCSW